MTESAERQVLGTLFFGTDDRAKVKLVSAISPDMMTSELRSTLMSHAIEGRSPEMAVDAVTQALGIHAGKGAQIELLSVSEAYVSDAATDQARRDVIRAHIERQKAFIGKRLAGGMSADEAYGALRDIMRADAMAERPGPKTIGELASEELFRQEAIGNGEGSRCMPIDLPPFDINGGLFPGDLWTIAAPQGCGKTMLALQAMNRAADRGARCLFLSLEMDQAGLARRLLAGGDARRLRSGLHPSDPLWSRIERRASALRSLDLSIVFAGGFSVEQLETEIRHHAMDGQVDVVAVDFFQLIRVPSGERNESRALERVAYALKFCAVDIGCTMLCLPS